MWCYIEKALVNILTDLKINKTRVISTGKLPLNVSLFENPNWLPYVIGNFAHSYLCRASLEKLGSILRRPVLSVRTTSILFWCPSDHQGRSGAQYLWQIELNYLLKCECFQLRPMGYHWVLEKIHYAKRCVCVL